MTSRPFLPLPVSLGQSAAGGGAAGRWRERERERRGEGKREVEEEVAERSARVKLDALLPTRGDARGAERLFTLGIIKTTAAPASHTHTRTRVGTHTHEGPAGGGGGARVLGYLRVTSLQPQVISSLQGEGMFFFPLREKIEGLKEEKKTTAAPVLDY